LVSKQHHTHDRGADAGQESNWLAPNKDLSKLPDPNNPEKTITFKEWEADPSSKAQLKSTAVGKVLSNWAMANDHSGLWTLGLQVKLPDTTGTSSLCCNRWRVDADGWT
jgi:hypothetical protein